MKLTQKPTTAPDPSGSATPTKRHLKPRPAVSSTPLAVSDQTSFDLVGLTGGQLRELARREPGAGWTRIGQRLVIRADKLLALLDRLASPTSVGDLAIDCGAVQATALADEPSTVADVLAILGRRAS